MTKRPITLRAWKREILPPIPINQGDILSRTVIITLEDYNGKLIDLTGAAVWVHFTKPDAKVVYLSAEIVNPLLGCVSVTLDSQCVAVKGTVTAIVQVTGADGSNLYLTGLSFDVADIDIEGSIELTNEFTALTEALSTVQQYDGRIADLETGKADKSDLVNVIYPVGAIYISVSSTNPSTFLGGTWERFARGQTLIGVDASDTDFNAAGKTGGSKTHTLTIDEMPKHSHTYLRPLMFTYDGTNLRRAYGNSDEIKSTEIEGAAKESGRSQPHNNMPPYVTVYMWQRIS